MKKNFKSTALLYIFFCIGALLLLRGTSIYGRRKNYHEANAVFIKSTYILLKIVMETIYLVIGGIINSM